MTFLLGRWLKAMNGRAALGVCNHRRTTRTRSTRFVPRLETLEDRTVPSMPTVTSAADSGTGSLRADIAAANSGDTITFAPGLAGQTIALTSGELAITKSLDIEGPGANQLTISGGGYNRVFDITASSASVTIASLTISNGLDNYGSGILNAGTLTVNDCTLSGNTAFDVGGAIANFGTLTVNNSTLSGNEASGGQGVSAYGGAIYNNGALSIDSSTLASNSANGGNGSSGFSSGPYGPTPGTPAGNGLGGGLYIAAGTVTIDRSTAALNAAVGGIFYYTRTGGDAYGGLGAGGAIYNAAGAAALQMHDTILAGGNDLDGSVTSLGHNLIDDSSGGSGFASSDLLNVNPQLGPLQNNGGSTQTMALLAGSPAIDAGDNAGAPAYDQRGPGFPRIVNGTIDLGAYEVQSGS